MSGPADPVDPAARAPRLSNLQTRVISAVVLAAVALSATWAGGIWFRLLAVAIGAAVFFEWATMAGRVASIRQQAGSWVLVGLVLLALAVGMDAQTVFLGALGAALLVFLYGRLAGEGGWLWLAVAYAAIPAAALAFLRDGDAAGLWAILFLFAVVWATDILAYFVGRAVGGPKLAPSISPGKTWSGAIGGAAAGTLAGIGVAAAAASPASPWLIGLAALLLSVLSQMGDLFESGLKRRFGVKDSGWLIPGHGGVMDRVDGLVAAAIALSVVGALAAGADMPAHGLFGP
ncbi:MAG: phosphatidate cytidylyltransferase [Rhizobiales bacterium]|nr:phosphatidate cytidylyltransferase [Hyphomicrobiales bacterium]